MADVFYYDLVVCLWREKERRECVCINVLMFKYIHINSECFGVSMAARCCILWGGYEE